MVKKSDSRGIVVVAGDVTVDWNLARIHRTDGGVSSWNANDWTRAHCRRGGAALLADLLESVTRQLRAAGGADWQVRRADGSAHSVDPEDRAYHHSYAVWSLFEKTTGDRQRRAWRVAEYLGLDRGSADVAPAARKWNTVANDTPDAHLVVLDDAGLGFREHREFWPSAISTKGRHPWILLKIAPPVAQGELWEHLHRECADRLIVVMTVDDLRLTEVQISRELSWERTAQDVVWEIVHNPSINALSHCAHVVVSFDTAGAILFSRAPNERSAPAATLFFDPRVVEGAWGEAYPGHMIGNTASLSAAIARQILLSPDRPDITAGIHSGLSAMRKLHLEGYGEWDSQKGEQESERVVFPVHGIVAELNAQAKFATAAIQDPLRLLNPSSERPDTVRDGGMWSILQDRYPGSLDKVAERIVLEGAEAALKDVPLGRFGALLTVDRREIEGFRSIRTLIGEYCRKSRVKNPLSIAVFGAPGSGKSFGVTEVAKSLLPGQIKKLEFNLSQLSGPEDLLDALHQVRDEALSGMIPLVFWDEFDSTLTGQRLGWLPYFLAPMQDGRFQQGQISHPIGRAIFVFAGGTSPRMETFGKGLGEAEFRAVKGPDFVSRLKGFVNINGPNRQRDPEGNLLPDPYFLIRRGILLRSILSRDAHQILRKSKDGKEVLNIDSGVLRALLHTREYKHGVRSMESVIATSLLHGKTRFERSCLPASAQLNLHVNEVDFLAQVQQLRLQTEVLEKLAEAVHTIFCSDLKAKGYRHGPQTDDAKKIHNLLKPYCDLQEDEKEQNRDNVRDIAGKLAAIGYVMTPARSGQIPFNFPGPRMEELAEWEHDRWMRAKIQAGWRYGPRTDKAARRHNAILPWRKLARKEMDRRYTPAEIAAMGNKILPENEKAKDRELVRQIPRILHEAGYTVLDVNEK
jgi:hypothetical protein